MLHLESVINRFNFMHRDNFAVILKNILGSDWETSRKPLLPVYNISTDVIYRFRINDGTSYIEGDLAVKLLRVAKRRWAFNFATFTCTQTTCESRVALVFLGPKEMRPDFIKKGKVTIDLRVGEFIDDAIRRTLGHRCNIARHVSAAQPAF